jgi:hypothetical protein
MKSQKMIDLIEQAFSHKKDEIIRQDQMEQ